MALGARDPGVLGGLGRAARVAGRLGTGLQWLERAAVATPDDVGVAAERLALASDAGDPVSRLAAAQTLDAVMGDWEPWARLALAAALLDTGDPGAAMGVLDRLPASVVPEGAAEGALVGGAGDAARRTRAVALGALGRAHEGLAALGEPQDPAGVAVRARLLAAAGRADGAWALAEGLADEGSVGLDAVEAVARVTGDAARGVALLAPRAPLRAASLGLELGAVAAAEAALDGALDPSARAARATLLTGDGRAEQAVALLGPVVASGAATDGERRAFGLARDAAGDRFGAIAVMESLREDGAPRAASWLAGALLAADVGDGELRRAERLARAAWDRAPGDASGLDLLARILLRAGRTAEAASLAERATRAAPGDPRFRATLETARQLAADGRSAP